MGARELRQWCWRGPALAVALVGFARAASGAADLPPERDCPAVSGPSDAEPLRLREGMTLKRAEALRLAPLLPAEVSRHRDAFFPEGMQMVIGACHRRYPVPRYFHSATQRFAPQVELDANGNLSGYTAGLPFPVESIDPARPDAAMRWAWNFELRHRGAGPVGQFRFTELSADGDAQSSTGSWFQLQVSYRADLPQTEYRVVEAPPAAWIAGGRFSEPSGARGIAWLQTRERASAQKFTLPDDVFVFVPSLAKVRRAASAWVDGLYLPSHRALGRDASAVGPGGAIASGAAATDSRARGLLGLSVRPNAYVWRMLGAKQVVAPINASRGGFPGEPARSFGTSGLSLASDRWDVRQAVAIQGALREGGREYDWLTLYIDVQTQQPLYVITERRRDRRRIGVGILLHRWSGDRPGYPAWPDGAPAAVFDPAAMVFFDESDGSGWRRESYDARSVPLPPDEVRYRTTSAFLERAR